MNLQRMGKKSKLLHVIDTNRRDKKNACRQSEIRKAAEMQRRKDSEIYYDYLREIRRMVIGRREEQK